jgi:hypothetical protein
LIASARLGIFAPLAAKWAGPGEGPRMAIHDDADMETVVKVTVASLQTSDLHIGKADRQITDAQIAQVEAAVERLRKTLDFKKRINAGRS